MKVFSLTNLKIKGTLDMSDSFSPLNIYVLLYMYSILLFFILHLDSGPGFMVLCKVLAAQAPVTQSC